MRSPMTSHTGIWIIVMVLLVLIGTVSATTTVFYPDATGFTDGTLLEGTNAVWPIIRLDFGESRDLIPTLRAPAINSASGQTQHLARRFAVSINTSDVPDTDIIDSVIFHFYSYGTPVAEQGNPGVGITGFTPHNANATLATDDYHSFGDVLYSDMNESVMAFTNDTHHNYTFNAAGLANISKTGYTSIMVRFTTFDIFNSSQPTGGLAKDTGLYIADLDHTSGNLIQQPYFEIVHHGAPVASFTANVTYGTAPLAVAFTDTSTNTPTDWDWYVWDNETKSSDEQNPVIVFDENGGYDIRLYASNAAGGDWSNQSGYITVNDYTTPPASITNLANTTTCSNITWTWDNPADEDFNGTEHWLNGTQQFPNLTKTDTSKIFTGLAENTSYTFSTKTFDNATPPNVNATFVNQTAKTGICETPPSTPVASFSLNRFITFIPQPIIVNDTSTNTPTSWNWSWGDGAANATARNATHSYSRMGLFRVNLESCNAAGCDDQSQLIIALFGNRRNR